LYLDKLVPHGAGDEGLPQPSQEVLDAAAQNVNVNLKQIKQHSYQNEKNSNVGQINTGTYAIFSKLGRAMYRSGSRYRPVGFQTFF
jgi:hypothetical protein